MATGWISKNIFTGLDTADIQIAKSSNQFVFVNGRQNDRAKRIIINSRQQVVQSDIGVAGSYYFPTIESVRLTNTDNKGMKVGKGARVGYCYTEVNEFEEESPPSPMEVFDFFEYQIRGIITADSDYNYDSELRGSIESISVKCKVTSSLTRRINLYRCDGYGSESVRPVTPLRLVKSTPIFEGSEYVTMIDSYPYSPILANYDITTASSGDDIAISGGTIFISNAINVPDYPATIVKILRIDLINPNEREYINSWFMVDLFDDTVGVNAGVCPEGQPKLTGFNWADFDPDKTRFLDTDFITPLNVILYPLDAEFKPYTGATAINTRRMARIQLPILQKSFTKSIYMIISSDDLPADYPRPIVEISDLDDLRDFYALTIKHNPVRSDGTIINTCSQVEDAERIPSIPSNYLTCNRANENYETNNPQEEEIATPVLPYDEYAIAQGDDLRYNGKTSFRYYNGDDLDTRYHNQSLFLRRKGFAHLHVYFAKIEYDNEWRGLYDLIESKQARLNSNWMTIKVMYRGTETPIPTVQLKVRMSYYVGGAEKAYIETTAQDVYGYQKLFLFLSWEDAWGAVTGTGKLNLFFSFVAFKDTNPTFNTIIYSEEKADQDYDLSDIDDAAHWIAESWQFTCKMDKNSNVGYSHHLLEMGDYVNHLPNALQFARHMPYFPLGEVGFVGIDFTTTNIGADPYYNNANIAIEEIFNVVDYSPGKLMWSKYGAMSQLNVKNIHDEILRVYPIKSFMPTYEHETVLIFTKDMVRRLSLQGETADDCTLIIEWENIGLTNKKALVAIDNGIAWISNLGVHILTQNGKADISDFKVPTTETDILSYDYLNHKLWLIVDDNTAHIYDLRNSVWSHFSYPDAEGVPRIFFRHKNLSTLLIDYCYPNSEQDAFYWYNGAALPTKIKTKAFRIGRRGKSLRWSLRSLIMGTTYTFSYLARLFGTFLTSGTEESPTYSGKYYNRMTSVPNLRSEYVQLEIDNADEVTGIELEIKE
jgi:hypothetical protein